MCLVGGAGRDRREQARVRLGIPVAGDEREVLCPSILPLTFTEAVLRPGATEATIGGWPIAASSSFWAATLAMTERALAAAM